PVEIGFLQHQLAQAAGAEAQLHAHALAVGDTPQAVAETIDADGPIGVESDLREIGEAEVGLLEQVERTLERAIIQAGAELGHHLPAARPADCAGLVTPAIGQVRGELPVALYAGVERGVVVVVRLRLRRRSQRDAEAGNEDDQGLHSAASCRAAPRSAMRRSSSGRKWRMRPWIGQAAASPRAQMVWPSTCLVTWNKI